LCFNTYIIQLQLLQLTPVIRLFDVIYWIKIEARQKPSSDVKKCYFYYSTVSGGYTVVYDKRMSRWFENAKFRYLCRSIIGSLKSSKRKQIIIMSLRLLMPKTFGEGGRWCIWIIASFVSPRDPIFVPRPNGNFFFFQ